MATHRISIFGPMQNAPLKKGAGPLRLPSAVKTDILREWVFGGVTRTVLYEAGLPVLMS
jgi:hypothetical protein